MNRLPAIAWILVAALVSGAGCYTVLRHPAAVDMTQAETGEPLSCADCHADANLYHPYAYDLGWYGYYPPAWASYYATPWWYDSYWYYPHDGGSDIPPAVSGGRTIWSREGAGGSNAPLPTQGSGVSNPTKDRPNDPNDKPGRDDGSKDDDKKDKEKKDERRPWRR
ncbi:MAG: hypothetical protein ACE15D_12905 [Candidatus Eisenbacteria bacterium]|nr:hypothetical protein [Candidatus Eisenbacteria bacterium]